MKIKVEDKPIEKTTLDDVEAHRDLGHEIIMTFDRRIVAYAEVNRLEVQDAE